MTLALAVAASAPSPKNRPTQIELIDPLSDCRMLDASVGSANRMSVRVMGPDVRSRAPRAGPLAGPGVGPGAGPGAEEGAEGYASSMILAQSCQGFGQPVCFCGAGRMVLPRFFHRFRFRAIGEVGIGKARGEAVPILCRNL